jgi:hypothetical protein
MDATELLFPSGCEATLEAPNKDGIQRLLIHREYENMCLDITTYIKRSNKTVYNHHSKSMLISLNGTIYETVDKQGNDNFYIEHKISEKVTKCQK